MAAIPFACAQEEPLESTCHARALVAYCLDSKSEQNPREQVLEPFAMDAQNGFARITAVDDSAVKRSKTVAVAYRAQKAEAPGLTQRMVIAPDLSPSTAQVSRRVAMGAAEARVGSACEEEAHNAVAPVAACEEKRRPAASTSARNASQDIDRRATARVLAIQQRADDVIVPLSCSQVKSRLTQVKARAARHVAQAVARARGYSEQPRA